MNPKTDTATVLLPGSELLRDFGTPDYLDCYEASMPGANDPEATAKAVFRLPAWVKGLLQLRNLLVKPLGLKTGPAESEARTDGLPFRMLYRTGAEIVMGETDRHLDFRVSVLIRRPGAPDARVFASTAVRFHNALGRVYFFLIRPFHGLILRTLLKQAAGKTGASADPVTAATDRSFKH